MTSYSKGVILLLALASVAVRMVFSQNLEYHRDELLYYAQAAHLSFGYASVPPVAAWCAALMQAVFGNAVWAVKLLPAVLSGGMVLVCAGIAKELGGGSYARVLAAAGFAGALCMLRTFFLFQPVFLDVFFWTATLYAVIRLCNEPEARNNWILLGAAVGLGLLTKYLIGILTVCLLLAILAFPQRKWLVSKGFIVALGVAFALFLPNIWWQYLHDFPVFDHMKALREHHLVHVAAADFWSEQLLMPFGATLLTLPGLYGLLKSEKYRPVGAAIIGVLVVLWGLQAKSYYTLGIFPGLFAAGAVQWERWLKGVVTRTAVALFVLFSAWPLLPIGLPVYPVPALVAWFDNLYRNYGIEAGQRFEDGSIHALPQDYADMLGWEELVTLVNEAYRQVEKPEETVIFCGNYGQAGAISVIGKKYGLPEPVSFHESFLYWLRAHPPGPVSEFINVDDRVSEEVKALFSEITYIGEIREPYAREKGTKVYLCRKPVGDVSGVIRKEMLERDPF